MSLWITAKNIFTDQDDVADYEVKVGINGRTVWTGFVEEHPMRKGAAELVRRIAHQMEMSRDWTKEEEDAGAGATRPAGGAQG